MIAIQLISNRGSAVIGIAGIGVWLTCGVWLPGRVGPFTRIVRTAVALRLCARGRWSALTGSSSAAALRVDIGRHTANHESERANHPW